MHSRTRMPKGGASGIPTVSGNASGSVLPSDYRQTSAEVVYFPSSQAHAFRCRPGWRAGQAPYRISPLGALTPARPQVEAGPRAKSALGAVALSFTNLTILTPPWTKEQT